MELTKEILFSNWFLLFGGCWSAASLVFKRNSGTPGHEYYLQEKPYRFSFGQ